MQRIRSLFLLITSIWLTTSLRAQFVLGLEGGLSLTELHTNISNRAASSLAAAPGYVVATTVRYKVWSWCYLTVMPSVLQKNYTLNRTDSLTGAYERFNNTYLQMPLTVGLTFGRHIRWWLDPGLYLGYWTAGRRKGAVPDILSATTSVPATGAPVESFSLAPFNTAYEFVASRDNRWEFGWTFGIQALYPVKNGFGITAATRFYQALTALEKASASPTPAYNRTWSISLGMSWAPSTQKRVPPHEK